MINRIIIIICLALATITADAQTITDQLRSAQQGQGKVVINQSAEIERLVNNQPSSTAKPTESPAKSPTKEQAAANHSAATEPSATHSTTTPSTSQTTPSTSQTTAEGEGAAVNTNKKIMRHSYKTTGYRIQVYSGGNKREDRQKCEQISARLKASFPNLPIYVHFYSPSWKCRAGNFTDQAEAKAVLKQIRAMGYTQACLVKGTINVQY